MKFNVPDMSCGHCVAAIEKAVKAVDTSANVACDLDTHVVEIGTSAGQETITAALRDAGYDASPL
ncbi:heavy-metal-associated domain-containing protein [uncultured Roseibium sp.]|uniref:heavy-metal-associated domain-containing protein n=1 Tax=uncultured Roseibium sp. TaxID=1936171 RepID=UPI003216BA44